MPAASDDHPVFLPSDFQAKKTGVAFHRETGITLNAKQPPHFGAMDNQVRLLKMKPL